MRRIIISALILVLLSGPSFAEIYKWTDDKGGVHFTEDSSTIPEKYKNQAEQRETPPPEPSRPSTPQTGRSYGGSLLLQKGRIGQPRTPTVDKQQFPAIPARPFIGKPGQKTIEPPGIQQQQRPPQQQKMRCSYCLGKGYLPCSRCNAGGGSDGTRFKGKVQKILFERGGPRTIYVTCPDCGGTGEKRCPQCNGVGYVWR